MVVLIPQSGLNTAGSQSFTLHAKRVGAPAEGLYPVLYLRPGEEGDQLLILVQLVRIAVVDVAQGRVGDGCGSTDIEDRHGLLTLGDQRFVHLDGEALVNDDGVRVMGSGRLVVDEDLFEVVNALRRAVDACQHGLEVLRRLGIVEVFGGQHALAGERCVHRQVEGCAGRALGSGGHRQVDLPGLDGTDQVGGADAIRWLPAQLPGSGWIDGQDHVGLHDRYGWFGRRTWQPERASRPVGIHRLWIVLAQAADRIADINRTCIIDGQLDAGLFGEVIENPGILKRFDRALGDDAKGRGIRLKKRLAAGAVGGRIGEEGRLQDANSKRINIIVPAICPAISHNDGSDVSSFCDVSIYSLRNVIREYVCLPSSIPPTILRLFSTCPQLRE